MTKVDTLVQFCDVVKRFGATTALDKISLDIQPGSIIGLVGSNGAGKSTLLRHIIGLYLPDAGTCTTLGMEARRLGPAEFARLGYVHQEGELIDWMNVGQLIRYVAAYYATWNTELEQRYVKDFELNLKDRVGSLSPGQRQKLAILLAIGFEPELLILDEPASALDPLARRQFLNLMLEMIQTQNRTIIISSHILSDVEKIIDHIVIMDKGRIVRNCALDTLQEEFCRVTLTAAGGKLPESLPFRNAIDWSRSDGQAVLTLRHADEAQIVRQAETIGCQAQIRRMSLDELYEAAIK
ncbi:MAG TPA: ABC transporter ATP-binding protein [Anaerohalosphaeraceae bacterium]|nr:ABC transporter ATP-binding protein [Anaerohalosphaeraceae bacterium]